MTTKEIGNLGEAAVCTYLKHYGFEIIKRNFCIRGGEIDIIATREDIIAFVEVKTRASGSQNNGFDKVDIKKQKRLIKAACVFLSKYETALQPRFDVAVVTFAEKIHINYIKNAFST